MTPFSTQSYRRYLKFLRCLGCLSSVCILALTGCSAKHYAQMPLAEQNSVRPQAKAAAAADAKRDVEVLASFGAGMSATFAAGMCGLMMGFIASTICRFSDPFRSTSLRLSFGCQVPRSISQRVAPVERFAPSSPWTAYPSIQRETLHFQRTAASTSRPALC